MFCSPFLLLLTVYFITDPFEVLYHYDSYYNSNNPFEESTNRGLLALTNWLNRSPGHAYNSYILGNSRAMYYEVGTWSKHIHEDARACYHMDAYTESLFAIERKLNFLHERKAPIKNALIILDATMLPRATAQPGFLFGTDYRLSGESYLHSQATFAAAFFKAGFIFRFLQYSLLGLVKKDVAKDAGVWPFTYDPVTNEVRRTYYEELIRTDSAAYYQPRRGYFIRQDTTAHTDAPVIGPAQEKLFASMMKILRADSTNYRIIISPGYDQVRLNPEDVRILRQYFGAQNVYDFSGVNAFTADQHNFYDDVHYRPQVAAAIMEKIYKN